MAVIILTIYAIIASLGWGIALGKQLQREKDDKEMEAFLKKLTMPHDIHIDLDSKGLPHILNEMHKDLQANLQGTQAVVKAMTDIKDTANTFAKPLKAGKEETRTPEYYVHQLEYARDRLELSPGQKRALNAIINKVMKTYGGH